MNPKSWLAQNWQLGRVSSLSLLLLTGLVSDCLWDSFTSSVGAQVIPDETLGAERSLVAPVAPGVPIDQITGGASRGANLFHSFEQFNISKGQITYFTSPTGIENILSRVTGGTRSEILGTLGVIGTANLFLINPNGIIFGPNATLDVRGSFVATTADAIEFGTQGVFSAFSPDAPPVLTVNPSALLFNQIAAASITNESVAVLRVRPDQSLLLVGGDVELAGAQLEVLGGRMELGGVSGSGTVGLNINDTYWQLSYPEGVQRADIFLNNGTRVIASSGDIQLSGRHIKLTEVSEIVAEALGSEPGGSLTLTASESVEVVEESRLSTQTNGSGTAGNLTIETGQLIVRNGAQVGAGTFSEGEGGTLSITASNSITVSGTSSDGQIASGLFTQTEDAGDAGNLRIETGELIVQDGGQISASTLGEGNGGQLSVIASDSVQLSGTTTRGNPSGLFAIAQGGSGDAGELQIETRRLIVQDGAVVSASTFEGAQGRGGTLSVTASESVEVSGTSADSQVRSGLLVGTTVPEAAGDLTIETGRLIVQDGAIVSAGTLNEGQGGTLTVTATESVELNGTSANGQFSSSLLTQSFGEGDAGNLNITTAQLIVRDGAEVTVSSQGLGNAGSLILEADSILLENQGSLRGETASGLGGNITLNVQDLILMRYGSAIATTAANNGSGGNITLNAPFLVAVPTENSDIVANADQGFGGQIDITATSIYGLEFREELTRESDINASSNVTGQDGTVEINTLDVDPSRGLTNLPIDLVDASSQIAQNCRTGSGQIARNEFIVTGRGGLPDNPSEALSSDTVWTDLRSTTTTTLTQASTQNAIPNTNSTSKPLVEAQGWVINDKGKVVLMAQSVHHPSLGQSSCPVGVR